MKTSFYGRLKKGTSDFLRTVNGQFTKDLIYLTKSLYAPAVIIATIVLLAIPLYEARISTSLNSYWAFRYSLTHNIFTLGIDPLAIFNAGWIIMLIPAINIADDIENRNFEILRTFKINSVAYYVGKVLSSMLYVFFALLVISYVTEGALFYYGYAVTSKLLIDPIYVSMAIMPIIMPMFFISFFVSSLVGNKTLSVFFILAFFIAISLGAGALQEALTFAKTISPFNTFLLSLNTAYSYPVATGLLGMRFKLSMMPYLKYHELLYVISLSSIIFMVLAYLVIFFRSYYVKIWEKLNSLGKGIILRGDQHEEE